MTRMPPYQDLLTLIEERATAFREAVAVADPVARIPGCPDWTVRDLVTHLGGVHRFWAATVAAGPADGSPPAEAVDGSPPAEAVGGAPSAEAVGGGDPHGDLLEWSAESTRLLLDALRVAPPDQGCWTWWEASGAPMTAGAVARHQVQEAAVHAYDAQEAAGKAEPVPAAIAVDAIAEFLEVGLGSVGAWPHRPARIALSAVEGPTWLLDLTPAGAKANPAPSGEPVATIRASASDLLLFLYRRIGAEAVTVTGDRSVVDDLIAWPHSS
ncbi:maleylpyruvate isomerase family mycothiol-dependent enzyme [Actinoplanes sp. NPDC049548]|uniref:maleylpyruvate isomerase family mycothiol-dependent enzyme n=1 Tax=Actinoplanes sp. NPDC049548 TaxID=3155152 RepID=UPI0034232226